MHACDPRAGKRQMSQQTLSPKRRPESSWGKVPNKNLWPPHACTPAYIHIGSGEGGGQNGKNICSIIVLLANKTERPEDSKNRQISVKKKNSCQIHYYFTGNKDLPNNTNCVPAVLQQGCCYYYYQDVVDYTSQILLLTLAHLIKISGMYATHLLVSCCVAQAHLELTQPGLIALDPPTSASMLALQACFHHDSLAHAHTQARTHKVGS